MRALLLPRPADLDIAALCEALLECSDEASLRTLETLVDCVTWILLLRGSTLAGGGTAMGEVRLFKRMVSRVQVQLLLSCSEQKHAFADAGDGALASLLCRALFVTHDSDAVHGSNLSVYFPDSTLSGAAQAAAMRMATDSVPLQSSTLKELVRLRELELPIVTADILLVAEALVSRAASALPADSTAISDTTIVSTLLGLCRRDSESQLVTRASTMLVMLGSMHGATIGRYLWQNEPAACATMKATLKGAAPAELQQFGIGERLASCRDPDFLLEVIAEDEVYLFIYLFILLMGEKRLILYFQMQNDSRNRKIHPLGG